MTSAPASSGLADAHQVAGRVAEGGGAPHSSPAPARSRRRRLTEIDVTVPPETVTATGMPPALNWAVVDAGTAGVVTSPAAVGQGTMTSEVSTNLLSAMSQRPCWAGGTGIRARAASRLPCWRRLPISILAA